jgi:type IV pilus assembly protein PilE
MQQRSISTSSGFTLIEVMITVAIVGILVMVAFPSYQQYVGKSFRGKALACIVEHAQFMERYYTTNMTYEDPGGGAPLMDLGCRVENGLDSRYLIGVNVADARSYVVTAVPQGAQTGVDGGCGDLSLDQSGTRAVTGTASLERCW